MAELDYNQMSDDPGLTLPALGSLVNFAGALVSLGLVAGLGWWGYQLVVRDVTGVPVVRALEGPMRIAPEDPGGELAGHTGLAVNSIPAQGIAEDPAERLVLAPENTSLTDEDVTGAELAQMTPAPEATEAPIAATPETVEEAAVQAEIGDLISSALAEATGTIQGPSGEVINLISADVGGVTTSLIPVPRPASFTTTTSASASTQAAPDGVLTMASADIPAGTRLAQLGAFDSAEIARTEWARLAAKFPEHMTDKSRVIEKAQSGGKMFYRLRAHGFEGLADARRFCAALVSGQVNCIPVRQR